MEHQAEYWDFVYGNADADIADLLLRYGAKELPFDLQDAVMQIEARRKGRRKIPWFIASHEFKFPSLQASEQASNQAVSLFHAEIIGQGRRIADLTAGLGIDAMTVSLHGNDVDTFELDPHRAEVLKENAVALGLQGFTVRDTDSIRFLSDNPELRYDWLFIDPARRDSAGNRIFRLQDSLPDVIGNMDLLLAHAPALMIKASPLLDITQTLRDLDGHKCRIQIVSFRSEVKEVLIIVSDFPDITGIDVVDIADAPDFPKGDVEINYRFHTDSNPTGDVFLADAEDVAPGRYLYEAGAGMRKLHCASVLCGRYPALKALSTDSELLVSEEFYPDFPGRINKISNILSGKDAKRLQDERIRVVSSRYPVAASDLRRKYRLSEGDAVSLYATALSGGKKVLILAESV